MKCRGWNEVSTAYAYSVYTKYCTISNYFPIFYVDIYIVTMSARVGRQQVSRRRTAAKSFGYESNSSQV